MSARTVADVLDQAAEQLPTRWRAYEPANPATWDHSVVDVLAYILAPEAVQPQLVDLTGSRERADLGEAVADFLAHYVIDYIGDYACWTGDDETEPHRLDTVETILAWEDDDRRSQPLTVTDVATVIRAAAIEWRERQADREARALAGAR